MKEQLRCLHYVNQFFGQLGGEEKANTPLKVVEGPVGPGAVLQNALGGGGESIATIVSGDNYFIEEKEEALLQVIRAIDDLKPDLVIAGPAFGAGRYGLACAEVCRAAQNKGISAVTAMSPENPGVLEHGRELYIFPTEGVTTMKPVLEKVLDFGTRLVRGAPIGTAEEEEFLPRGIRKSAMADEPGYKRAVDMLIKKLKGESFKTEIPVILPDKVQPPPAIKDVSKAEIALVTTCGLIPKGNPDGQVSRDPDRFHRRSVKDLKELTNTEWEAFHSGYYDEIASGEPNYILPLRQMRILESDNKVGRVHPNIYTLAGVNGSVANAKKIGRGIARELINAGVDGVILTSA